jgi:hypothetical protein
MAVITPVSMKQQVPTKDRIENRARPQMPCPEVQPLPSRVPTPTVSPARANVSIDKLSGVGKFGSTFIAQNPAATMPVIKRTRQVFSGVLLKVFELGRIISDVMPLKPVTRPNKIKFAETATPKSAPPIKDSTGVNVTAWTEPFDILDAECSTCAQ